MNTYGGGMTGPGALILGCYDSGNKLWIGGTNNTYAGGTILYTSWGGTLYVATNATLGNGDVMVTGATALNLCGDRNIGGDNSTFVFDGLMQPAYAGTTGSLHKVGTGTFYFKGLSTLTGTNVVDGGALVVDGSMAGGITVNSGATLAGAGSVGAVTLNAGATFLPGSTITNGAATNQMRTLSSSSLALNSGAAVTVNLYGPTNYTQLVVNGPVNLGGAILQANLWYKPAPTDVFYIVLNTSASATTPGFAGLAEGAIVNFANGYRGHISYVGTGDGTVGNDVKIYNVTKGANGTAVFFQ